MTAIFNLDDLARCNGTNGSPILIAFQGKVYDVSKSYHWRGRKHHAEHRAGQDLTAFMKMAPHGEDSLEKFPVLGILEP